MGMECEVNSLEDMCDLMCDNKIPTPKREWWIFTFGWGMPHGGKYVKIKGTYGEARQKMCDKYGTQWAFQYSEKEWEDMKNDPKRFWDMEVELEVIK